MTEFGGAGVEGIGEAGEARNAAWVERQKRGFVDGEIIAGVAGHRGDEKLRVEMFDDDGYRWCRCAWFLKLERLAVVVISCEHRKAGSIPRSEVG